MKSKTIVSAIALAALSLASVSFAQGNDRRGPGHDQRYDQRFDQRGPMHRVDDHDAGRFDHRDARNDRDFDHRGPQFHRGGRIAPEYRRHQYVVNDWRSHHLHSPGRGQQWVQVGGDYALIAIASGVIADLVLNH